MLVHHLALFFVEVFSFTGFFHTLLRVLLSTAGNDILYCSFRLSSDHADEEAVMKDRYANRKYLVMALVLIAAAILISQAILYPDR
ncbi:MAG: hypothetical protein MZV63_51810 [Marinilabiliales bacterium]|nr:hypothetical protein [Marinilabiliales bacterium]